MDGAGCSDAISIPGLGTISRNTLIMISAAIILFAMLAQTISRFPPENDVVNFFEHAEAMKSGLLPYKDFVFEFPPVSLLFFLIPGLFTSNLDTYAALFGIEVVLFMLLGLFFLLRIADRLEVNSIFVSAIFMILILIYFTESVKKFDVIPMAIVTASFFFFIEKKYPISYALMMVGGLVKIYPFLFIPIMIMINVAENRQSGFHTALRGIIACFIVGLISVIPLIAMSVPFSEIMSFLSFHTDRGFQVESVFGAIVQALGLFGIVSVSFIGAHDTVDVLSPLCDAVLPYWTWFCTILIFAGLIFVAHRISKIIVTDNADSKWVLIMASMLILLIFIITNKVFSTQYMMWLFPFFALIPMAFKGIRAYLVAGIVILSELLARSILSYYILESPEFLSINLVRDALLILMLIVVVCIVAGKTRVKANVFSEN